MSNIYILQKCLNHQACLNFVSEFLSYVKEKVTNYYNQTIYKFEWYPKSQEGMKEEIEDEISMKEIDPNNSEYAFLEDWFVSQMKENNNY